MLDGRLSLTTPEGVRLILIPAGPATRAWAWGLDFIIWLVAVICVFSVLGHSKLADAMRLLWLFFSFWAYPVLCEVYWRGRSVGKRALGIQVVRADGLPVGWRESMLRNLLLVADFLPMMYLSGLLCMFYDERFRRIGDIVAGTQVVYLPPKAQRPPPLEAEQALAAPFPLNPAQQRALIDLCERAPRLPSERVLELASLAEPLTGATGEVSLLRLRGIVAGLTQ